MANRYWVGGTNTWNGTAGNKWALTSGGAGGETVPTTADDVFFDDNSGSGAIVVTIATGNLGAKSINCTDYEDDITGTGNITVAGSITLTSALTWTHTGTVAFTGTGTLTTAGKTFSGVQLNGSGITLTLGDALNISTRALTITEGTFDTANYNVTAGRLASDSTSVRIVNLQSSTISISGNPAIDFDPSTNLTFNAGTSQINVSSDNTELRSGSQTFYNVSFTSGSVGTRFITGANTFNNLTLTASGTGLSQLSLAGNQTVTGTLTCAGNSAIARGFVRSNTIGTTRTITANAISANDCDFRDITIAGAASPISPTRGGDCGGNSGITFPAAKTVYRVGTNTTWVGSNSWALTSNGTGADANFPLAQDTAVIDTVATPATLGFGSFNIGTFDASLRTNALTLNTIIGSIYGSFILGSGITISGTNIQTFSGRGTQTFTSAGKTITFPITIDKPAGAFELGDAFLSSNNITFTRGTFSAITYNVTCTSIATSGFVGQTINMGSGLWTLSGTGTVCILNSNSNVVVNKDTADILLSNTSTSARTFSGGSRAYNKLTIGGATGTSILTITTGSNSFTELASTKTVAHTIRFNDNQGTIGIWSVTGTSGNVVTVDSSVAGTRRNFTLTNVTSGIDYLSVKDIREISNNKFYVGANSTDGGNNINVYFTASPSGGGQSSNYFLMF